MSNNEEINTANNESPRIYKLVETNVWPPTIVGGHRLIAEGGNKSHDKQE